VAYTWDRQEMGEREKKVSVAQIMGALKDMIGFNSKRN
jgi:hypothetical protein